MPYDFLSIIQMLLSTGDKNYCHIGIDLLIMFQSGLRFPSSINQ